MKKLILTFMCCATGLITVAQTNFRHISFDEAIAAAKQENKMVFIDFYTDWCGPCKMMAKEVFPQKKVGDYFNEKFVCVKFNAEKEGKELAARYQVKAYPTFIVLNTKEELQLDIKGAANADDFIAKVDAGLDPEQSPARMEARYNSGERTPELINRYALSYLEQGKETEGFKILDDYFASLTDAQRLSTPNAFLFTRYTIDLDNPKAKFMVAHRNEFDPSVSAAIADRIARLYHSKLVSYFSGYMLRENKYKEEEYKTLKKEIQDLDLDKNYEYAPMFNLIECRVKNDDATFLSMCAKEFNTLNSTDRDLLIMNLTRLINAEDKDTLKAMSEFIRERLSILNPNAISLAGRTLDSIESKLKEK
ncbi:thioredoxin family protein [Bacteroides bouchesdurhonensis]|uniref:thioredoxin family protein n=1 Tax=Bacteroides bouchesdurhonensis TaxID=1841855 RepID=UPI0009F903F7|nr:thioredoxin domain-containing protein [Bacteroides bouchesdurhonensis]